MYYSLLYHIASAPVPMTVPATGYSPVQVPAGMVYMVPQGYAPPPNYGVPMHAGQVLPQQVAAPPGHFNNGMVGDVGQYQAPGQAPPSYQGK